MRMNISSKIVSHFWAPVLKGLTEIETINRNKVNNSGIIMAKKGYSSKTTKRNPKITNLSKDTNKKYVPINFFAS